MQKRSARHFRASMTGDARNWGLGDRRVRATLTTPSPFDDYLAGDIQALSGPPAQG